MGKDIFRAWQWIVEGKGVIRDVERYWEVKVYLGVGFCVVRVFLGFSFGGRIFGW